MKLPKIMEQVKVHSRYRFGRIFLSLNFVDNEKYQACIPCLMTAFDVAYPQIWIFKKILKLEGW